ncbi:putative membrane protein of ER body-like protein [Heracleum sosnowskyi]|uniref:Membrane protein of ER body-like protein n=1 Tax=Heracleum sosnowskyi TaxID=360622 RepID=A0AAD8LYP2_9APIA|nr:putative membrane protein of ER body-like protein [Heracleum sosnowskyi]
MDQVMESTNGDAVVVGEILVQQRREVVVPKDPGLQGLDQQSSSDDTDSGVGMDMKSSGTGNGHHATKAANENFGKSVYFDEDTDSTDEWSLSKTNNRASESDVKQNISDADQGVSEGNEISPVISHEQEIKPEIPAAKVKSKHVKLENLIEESDDDEDVIELEFEREIKRLDTHTMHCPKCNATITKVVLRKKRTKKGLSAAHSTPKPEPVDLLGCLSCCSVFVPSGNCFSWIRLLANGGEDSEDIPQQTNVPPPGLTGDNGNMVIDKEGDCFSLFRIFGNKPEKKSTQKPLQQSSYDSEHAVGGTMINQENGHAQDGDRDLEGKPNVQVDQNVVLPVQNGRDLEGKPNVQVDQNVVLPVQNGRDLEGKPNVQVDQNVVLPVQNGSSSTRPNGGVSINQNGVGLSSSNHQNGTYSGYPKPPLSTSPGEWNIDLGEDIVNVPEGNGTSVGEEPGAIHGIGNEPARGEIPLKLTGTGDSKSLEIVKSIVYGGLMEFITSLSIVCSAAASGATTLNLITIGLANLIAGLIIIGHNLWDLKSDQCEGASNKYQEQLGKKENFLLHATFAVLSFLVFGLVSPATYGYAFDKMHDKNLTLVAVAIASLLCIIILASCKAYVMKSDRFIMYLKTIMYYICIALMVSGVSYEVGDLINELVEKYGWSEKTPDFPLSLPGVNSRNPVSWTSY